MSRRRIIVCLDGTWDTPQEKTNVNHFYHSIHSDLVDDFIQYKTYITGVGTDKFPLLGGMFGFGISDQIMSAYKFICNLYRNENDEIWLIGFSRGAYAARSLSGMIYNVGLLPEATVAPLLIRRAYDMYRNRMEGTKPGQLLATDFHKKYNTIVPHIEFLGCFDTVGALGVPKLPWYLGGSLFYNLFQGWHGLHDNKLVPIIRSAYHAVSIHDQRVWFDVTSMKYSSSSHTVKEQYVEQVWFPGMHGDVGGGQEKPSHLSTHPLAWMLFKAQTHGLVLNRYGHSMLTPCYDCPFFYQDSYTSMIAFRLLPRIDRVIDCDEKSNKYLESQIYLCGDFSSFIKSEDLAKYHSKALLVFKSHFDVNSENDVI